MSIENIKTHPFIAARETANEELVALKGYMGSKDKTNFKLYPDKAAQAYYEINTADAVYAEEGCSDCDDCGDKDGKITVYVKASARMMYHASASAADLQAWSINRNRETLQNALKPGYRPEKVPGLTWPDDMFTVRPDILFPGPDWDCLMRLIDRLRDDGESTRMDDRGVHATPTGITRLKNGLWHCGFRVYTTQFFNEMVANLEGTFDPGGDPEPIDPEDLPFP